MTRGNMLNKIIIILFGRSKWHKCQILEGVGKKTYTYTTLDPNEQR